MSNSVFNHVAQLIHSSSTMTATLTEIDSEITMTTTVSSSVLEYLTSVSTSRLNSTKPTEISLPACFGFVILILATVLGNTLVLLALYLDKRLHSPSFYLIANMAIADLLLGLSVLPFSSVLELLDGRWIFGESFCSAWLALDVLCCTASIMALMAVSVDRYIGVTRPLNYSTIMTTQRTIYLMIVVWAVSILTSVVPLFGLTDREKRSNEPHQGQELYETCKINKNTFYTIFSSLISFYIPVLILLILYSRVYQEAQTQGKKLENEKRRLYQIDYQIASEHVRRKQEPSSNGHTTAKDKHLTVSPRYRRSQSNPIDCKNADVSKSLLKNGSVPNDETIVESSQQRNDQEEFQENHSDFKNPVSNDDTLESGSSLTHHLSHARRCLGQRITSTFKRQSQSTIPNFQQTEAERMSANDELMIVKRKLHNLKREKKAFRTLGLILGALLICWLPFFVTLPLMSILKHRGVVFKDENTENTWFTITFWLGYCNSALNPFVYAFSNRAIQRAFRQVLFKRYCCCNLQCWLCRYFCPQKSAERYQDQLSYQYQRNFSNSYGTQSSQVAPRRTVSLSSDVTRKVTSGANGFESFVPSTPRTADSVGLVVSFVESPSNAICSLPETKIQTNTIIENSTPTEV